MNEQITLRQKLDAIEFLFDETAKSLDYHNNEPVPTSQAKLEMQTSIARSSGIAVSSATVMGIIFQQSTFLIESGADHMLGLKRALTEPVLTLVPWTCLRVVLSHVPWLVG